MNRKFGILVIIGLVFMLSCSNEKKYYVSIETEFGNMEVELFNTTPVHRDNFILLVESGYYDDLLFHRVINGFMIQGGDPDSKNAPADKQLGMGGPAYTLPAEIGIPHFKGALAAARTGGPSNPNKRSSGSQFYIVQGTPQDEASLNSMSSSRGFKYNETQIKKYKDIGGSPMLDMDYTVFGEVVKGLDVIDKIAAVPTGPGDRPVVDVKMKIKMSN